MARPRTVSDDAILAATANAVAASGPAGVTLAQIGAGVGLTAAALLKRFGSKDQLLLALARHSAEVVPARLAAAPTVAALVDEFVAMAASVRDSAEFANHLAFLLMDLSVPEFQQVAREYATAVESAIAVVLRSAAASGEIDPDRIDPGLARAIHAAYNGALITWGMTGAPDGPADQVRAQLLRVIR
ncbi:TetR/AcrR family transcriptional regulator [Actinoplanes sp. NPDC020271]|uniref:TetR/AcrR family transcriptional regulator n=1 Tax=Actinoplanes sp. NPDC020271 TaxID=3363896 RepID=UPI0037AF6A6D